MPREPRPREQRVDIGSRRDSRRWVATIAALCTLLLVCLGCAPERTAEREQGTLAESRTALAGQDGPLAVQVAGTILNQYAVLAADATAGATSIDVTNLADLDSSLYGPLGSDDLLLVIQMQGATIDDVDNSDFGTVTDLGGAGLHELIGVTSVVGNTVYLDSSAGGLGNSYRAAGNVQIVRVPQLSTLTVDPGASITSPAWDGQRGGIVAVHVATSFALDGDIDASALGFRGGAVDNDSQPTNDSITHYRSTNAAEGGRKGESIAGDWVVYDALYGGSFCRGAPANGGGGGNSHNAGGGGGANGNNGQPWTGQGVMDPTALGAAAWQLDPAYAVNGNALTTSSGGGRGGYTYAANDEDALTVAPSDPAWGGNRRRTRGGLGGRPLDGNASSRLFFGGGGGAGDGNDGAAGAGGPGGGLVYVMANVVTGTGSIHANGGNGADTSPAHNDAPGGGGGGGTIVVRAHTLSGVMLTANGGAGGNQLITGDESEGPGGGGGGGFIATAGGAVTPSAAGGTYGTTSSDALAEFLANGATLGALGQPAEDIPCAHDSDCGGPSSGTVCDDALLLCRPGCRGVDGNGCPDGEQCTSSDTTIGDCVPGGTGGGGTGGMGGDGATGGGGAGATGGGGAGATGGGGAGAGGAGLLPDDVVARGGCACRMGKRSGRPVGGLLGLAAFAALGLCRRRGRRAITAR